MQSKGRPGSPKSNLDHEIHIDKERTRRRKSKDSEIEREAMKKRREHWEYTLMETIV